MLSDNGRRNLVSQRTHRRTWRSDEDDLLFRCGKLFWKTWILRRVTPDEKRWIADGQYQPGSALDPCSNSPASPNGMNACPLGNINDQVDIGVIVIVASSRNLDVLICHTNVFGVHFKIFRSCHHNEFNRSLLSKRFVSPFSNGTNLFDCGNTVVANQYPSNDRMTIVFQNEFRDDRVGCMGKCVAAWKGASGGSQSQAQIVQTGRRDE